MESEKEFTSELSIYLENKKHEFNSKLLPQLQENFNIQCTAVQAIRTILLKKRVIHDDPYKYDSRMSEIEIPSAEAFADSEKASILGSRLSHYEMMLDFLTNYYQFTTEFLTPKKISLLIEFNNTFLWNSFSNTSKHPNTRGLADIMHGIFTSPDTLTISLLKDSISHLAKSEIIINQLLKDLSTFHREEYKLLIRNEILPSVSISQTDCLNPSNVLKEIKKVFVAKLKKQPFYTDLIIEIIKEDYSEERLTLRNSILQKLSLQKQEKNEVIQNQSYRHYLLSGLKLLGNTAPHFRTVLEKIKSNQELVDKSHDGFFKKIIKTLRQSFNLEEPEYEIAIWIVDPITQAKKRQVISYNTFEKEMLRKINLFQNINLSNSNIQKKIKVMNDEALLTSLTQYISECNELLKQMSGLDEFYKNTKPELRGKIRGIKIEITTITNSIIKANQCRAEYSAYTEEVAQMKRLGLV